MSVGMIVYRFENGARPIPFAIARLARMFDKYGKPTGVQEEEEK